MVERMDTGEKYEIEERLSTQFTARNIETDKVEFFFWKDKNVEWQETK